jgi:signal transduction histidine kinase/CheY-like chemotaxis protein
LKVSLNEEQRNTIFPANIAIDVNYIIISIGPVAPRLVPDLKLGGYLFDYITSGHESDKDYLSLASGSNKLIRFEPRGAGSPLVGWVVPSELGYILVLRISPDNFLLDGSNLQISDFAPGDPFVHGLLMFTLQRAMIEEQKASTKELAASRQKTENLLNRFSRIAGFMAHDFNNFLSIIRLNCDRLAKELEANDRLIRLVDIIRSTAARGSAITRSLMTLSNQREDTSLPVPVDQLISENAAFLSSVAGARARLALDLRSPGARTFTSPNGLLNCLVNLLINARDAMANGGTINIRTFPKLLSADDQDIGRAGNRLFTVLQIADTGSGMSKDVLALAFEPLFSTKAAGNGLGLASVRDFALACGGDAQIQSEQSVGTTVELFLPVWSRREDLPANSSSDAVLAENEGGSPRLGKILVVDDEPYALEALIELLGAAGFEVTGCTSAKAAEDELAKGTFDVLLTDIILKNESGTDLAKLATSRDPNLNVLLMSGYVPIDDQLDQKWAFVRKPINTQILIETIKSL